MPKYRLTLEGVRFQRLRFAVGPGPRTPGNLASLPRQEWAGEAVLVTGCERLQEAAFRRYARMYNLDPSAAPLFKVVASTIKAADGVSDAYWDELVVEARNEADVRDWYRQYARTLGRARGETPTVELLP